MPHYPSPNQKSGLPWLSQLVLIAVLIVCSVVFTKFLLGDPHSKAQEVPPPVETNAMVIESVSVVESQSQEPVATNATERALNEMGLTLSNSFRMSVK